MKKNTLLEARRQTIKVLVMIFISLFLVNFVAAWDWDNIKSYDKETEEITIKNALGLPLIGDDLAKIKLEYNTYQCLIDCEASGTITLYTSGYLFQEMDFKDIYGKDTNIQSYEASVGVEVTYETNEPIYKEVCEPDIKNGTICHNEIIDYKLVEQTRIEYMDAFNTVLEPGTYKWIIKGKKKPKESVDWIGTSFGTELDDWAWWNSDWNYKKTIYINETSGSELINYTLFINVTHDNMKSGFDDIRFVDSSETLELGYWFRDRYIKNDSAVMVGVKVPSLTASTNDQVIYMYYNNSAATHTGNITKIAYLYGNDWENNHSGIYATQGTSNIDISAVETLPEKILFSTNISGAGSPFLLYFQDDGGNPISTSQDASATFSWHNETGMIVVNNTLPTTKFKEVALRHITWGSSPVMLSIDIDGFNQQGYHAWRTREDATDGLDNVYVDLLANTGMIDYIAFLEEDTTSEPLYAFSSAEESSNVKVSTILNTENASEIVNFSIVLSANSTVSWGELVNITYYLWDTSHNLISSNLTIISGWNTTNLSVATVIATGMGDYNWNALSCGRNASSTNCNLATNNRTLSVKVFSEKNLYYNITAYETEEQEFQLNITMGHTVSGISANLIYNGTIYPSSSICSGGTCLINNVIDIPLISPNSTTNTNNTFYWEIALFPTTGSDILFDNSTEYQQNVSQIRFYLCDNSLSNPKILNISIKHESNSTPLNANFKGTFNYYLGNGTVFRTNFTESQVENSTQRFCSNINMTYRVNSIIELSKDGYSNRRYDFLQENYKTPATLLDLFLLNSSSSSTIIVQIKDQGLQPLLGWLSEAYRYYPGEGLYKLVSSQLTDNLGQYTEKFQENDVKYKFKFYDRSKTLKKTSDDIRIICHATYCILPFVIEEESTDFSPFTNLTSYTSSLTFNTDLNKFIFSWDDKREESSTHRLEVIRYLFNGTTTICNSSSTSTVGLIDCNVGDSKASYKAQGFRRVGSNERRIALLNIKVGDVSATIFGLEGLLWIFILLFTMIGVGAFNPVAGVTLYLVGFTALGLLGIITFNAPIFIANLVIGIIFIWAFRG